ncbi:natural killer cell receptor 2B4-like isoform X2 [Paramisgurnus dabryanus]|uniref:natural killer cell receptor 2B4-like isoform X2 n=1 Tax=Paramisgurnus dabryanus TaxID=90735 RepID=UPI0031F3C457
MLRTMTKFILLCLCFLTVPGVFGDEVKSVSVMEGDSVTLQTDTVKQKDDRIVWYYGPENTFVARINGKANSSMLSDDERFKDRVMVDNQTEDLIITDVTPQNSGDYTVKISSNNKVSYKKFSVNVYARLPVPDISSNSSQCSSSSRCVLFCSVLNMRDVSLSWYKGNSLLSSISVSDLNIRLSLPLEVEYQDTNTYSCVVNNPISNQTQHLNIKNLCQTCSDSPIFIIPVILALILCVIIIITVVYKLRRALKSKLKKPLHAKVPLNDEEKIMRSSSMYDDG